MAIDGSGATATASSTNSISAAITTSLADDIIIAFFHCELNASSITVNSVSGGGLTWTRRTQFVWGANNTIEIWWAYAHTPLTSQTITVSCTGSFDDASLQLIAFNGAYSFVTPWDTGGAYPYTALVTTSSVSVNITSSTPTSFVLGFLGSPNSNNGAAGSGFTSLYTTTNGGAALWSYTRSEYQNFSAAISSYPAGFINTAAGQGVVFDGIALVAPGLPPVISAQATQIAAEEWFAGTAPAQVTQVAAEEWFIPTASFQVTQVGVEHWFATSPQFVFTQVAVEHWMSVAIGVPTVYPDFIASGEILFAPTVHSIINFLPSTIPSLEQVFAPTLRAAAARLLPGLIASSEILYQPRLLYAVFPDFISGIDLVFPPTLRAGRVIIYPEFIPSAEQLFQPMLIPQTRAQFSALFNVPPGRVR